MEQLGDETVFCARCGGIVCKESELSKQTAPHSCWEGQADAMSQEAWRALKNIYEHKKEGKKHGISKHRK